VSDFAGSVFAFALGILCGYILRLWIELRAMEAVRRRILDDLSQREKEQGTLLKGELDEKRD